MTLLTADEIEAAGLLGWAHRGGSLRTRLRTDDFATGLALVDAIGAAAEERNHHPDLLLTYPHVDVLLTSHDAGGVTERDVALARRVAELAQAAGVVLDPAHWTAETDAD